MSLLQPQTNTSLDDGRKSYFHTPRKHPQLGHSIPVVPTGTTPVQSCLHARQWTVPVIVRVSGSGGGSIASALPRKGTTVLTRQTRSGQAQWRLASP